MTKAIEWGEAIEVSGRPDWLGDDEKCLPRWSNYWFNVESGSDVDCVASWDTVTAIKLPADHPYYAIQRYNAEHKTSFVYWPGGDEAPGDVDENGEVLFAMGSTGPFQKYFDWGRDVFHSDIIGYTPKPCAPVVEPDDISTGYGTEYMDSPSFYSGACTDFEPCERTVRMCIDYISGHYVASEVLRRLLPKPDRAEELVKESEEDGIQYDRQSREGAYWMAKFLIERGEIKG